MEGEMENRKEVSTSTNSALRQRIRAVAVAAVLIALPSCLLVSYYAFPKKVLAAQRQPLSAAASQTLLERQVAVNPTLEDRINLAFDYIQANHAARALPLLESVVQQDPRNAVAWNDLGVANTMLMNYDKGVDDCQRALAIAPGFQLARNNLKWAQGEFRKTVQQIAQQEQSAPPARTSSAYLAEGLNFLHIGNYDQAIHSWQRALELNSKDALSSNNIGTAYMLKHQPAIALTWFQRALSIDPSLQIAQNNEAWARSEIVRGATALTRRSTAQQ